MIRAYVPVSTCEIVHAHQRKAGRGREGQAQLACMLPADPSLATDPNKLLGNELARTSVQLTHTAATQVARPGAVLRQDKARYVYGKLAQSHEK
jgi:hypothetical protein